MKIILLDYFTLSRINNYSHNSNNISINNINNELLKHDDFRLACYLAIHFL
jgi:hypothetical protein